MNGEMLNDFAVLIVSCDRYRDLWEPSIALFHRFWPDCPMRAYLVTNHLRFHDSTVADLPIGQDLSWSDNVLAALKLIPEQFILLFIEDLFLKRPVDTEHVRKLCVWFKESGANELRFNPYPPPDKLFNDLVGSLSPGTLYRVGTQMSLWNRKTLVSLLKPGETAWEFELKGSERSDVQEGFYSTYRPVFPFINTVVKGKWSRQAVREVRALGIEPDLKARPMMSRRQALVLWYQIVRSRCLELLPARHRRSVRRGWELTIGRLIG